MSDVDVIALAKRIAASENLRGFCGRLCGLIGDDRMGTSWSVPSIGSANAAFDIASRAGYVLGGLEVVANFTPDMVGWLVHFEYHDAKNNGHMGMLVGTINGRAVMISMTANKAGFIEDLGNGMLLSYVDEYAKSRPLRGITAHMGARPTITGLTSPYAPRPLAPNERQVLSTKGLNIRSAPSGGATPILGSLPKGARFAPAGFLPGGEPVSGVSLWYAVSGVKGAHGLAWVWAGGTTEASGHDLRDLTPPPVVVEPPKPVVHTVTFGLPNGEVQVAVEDGQTVPAAAVPEPPYATGFHFVEWLLGDSAASVPTDPTTFVVVGDTLFSAHYVADAAEDGGPQEPEAPKPPVVDPQMQNLDDAATILADAVSPWLSSGVRAKVYEYATIGVAACGSVAGVASAVVLVVGSDSQVGAVAGTTALIAAAVGGAMGTFAARLARQNTPLEAAKRLAAQGDELGKRTVAAIKASRAK